MADSEARRQPQDGEDDEDALEQELEQAGLVQPPDGGYGWVVVFGSFLANVIVDGLIFTAGAGFLPRWEKDYNVSQGSAAWAVSILSGTYLVAGPIASALANYYGCRKVTIAGTLLSCSGFFISIFAPNIWILYITFGVIGGLGFGLIYLPAIVIVSNYFDRRRALATGIAVSGSGIGTMAFAPLTSFLLDLYSWQQALLIMTGVTLNAMISGALFRPLEPSASQVDQVADVARRFAEGTVEPNGVLLGPAETHLDESAVESPHVAEGVAIERFVSSESRGENGDYRRRERTFTATDHPFASVMELRARNRQTSIFSTGRQNSNNPDENDRLYRMISRESIAQINRPLSRMDIFYAGSMPSLQRRQRQRTGTQQSKRSLTMLSALSMPVDDEGEIPVGATWRENLIFTLRAMLDVSLLRSPSFLLLALGGFLTLTTFFVPFIYLPRQALLLGHSEERATLLISILGVTNIVARVLCGLISDQPWADALIVHNVAVTLAGVATILVPFFHSYALLSLYCVVFGVGTACFASLRSIICVELLGIEKLTSAYGFLLLFMGIAALIGSPIAGSLSDATGSYDISFYVMGTLLTVSGLICFPLRRINEWEKKREMEAYAEEPREMEDLLPSPNELDEVSKTK